MTRRKNGKGGRENRGKAGLPQGGIQKEKKHTRSPAEKLTGPDLFNLVREEKDYKAEEGGRKKDGHKLSVSRIGQRLRLMDFIKYAKRRGKGEKLEGRLNGYNRGGKPV